MSVSPQTFPYVQYRRREAWVTMAGRLEWASGSLCNRVKAGGPSRAVDNEEVN